MIISESPLFTIPQSSRDPRKVSVQITQRVGGLDKAQQHSFFALRNSFKELNPFMGIVKTNALPLGSNASSGGIFPVCSRFNHSCCSNAEYSWCSAIGQERVFAVKDIKEGEEITVSYLSDRFWPTARNERQQHLLANFAFRCSCDVCSRGSDEVSASNERRQTLSQLDALIGDGVLIVMQPGRALAHCKETLYLLEKEGESGVKIYATYYDAFQVCVTHGDFARASAMAGLAAKAKRDCQGNYADGIEDIEQLIKSPQSHRLAGTTSKWRSKVGHARAPESEGFEEWLWRRAG